MNTPTQPTDRPATRRLTLTTGDLEILQAALESDMGIVYFVDEDLEHTYWNRRRAALAKIEKARTRAAKTAS